MRKFGVLVTLVTASVIAASAQQSQVKDVRAVLEASLKAMGGANLKTIQYAGNGYSTRVGQNYTVNEDWPRFEVADYTRIIDYDAKWSREDYTRRQGNYPRLGNPPMPETRVTNILSGNYAWDMQGDTPVPLTGLYMFGAPYPELRQLELAITPHGFLKAALAAKDATAITVPIIGPSDFGLSAFGRKVTIVSFTMGKYRINGTINDQNLVELVGTAFPNPMFGDMDYEMRYTRYKDWGGVMFPGLVHVHHGDPRLNPAHNFYQYAVTDVKTNMPVSPMPVPDTVRSAKIEPAKVQSEKLADGVWRLAGGTHHSVLVEFSDFLAIVEAPQNEERSLAVMAEAERLAPNKLIRYVINTHHHMDHAGGLRPYLAQGTTVVTHAINKQYYLDILFHPGGRELQPDRLSLYSPMYMVSRRPAPIEFVGSTDITTPGVGGAATTKYVVTDHERLMEVLYVEDMAYEMGDQSYGQGNHSNDMLIVYLPKEKLLVNADLFSPPMPGAQPPATPSLGMLTLYQNMRKYRLDVTRHIGLHGSTATNDEFVRMIANKAEPQAARPQAATQ